jgi:hypothetical protein
MIIRFLIKRMLIVGLIAYGITSKACNCGILYRKDKCGNYPVMKKGHVGPQKNLGY